MYAHAHTCAPKKGLIFPRSTRPTDDGHDSVYNIIYYNNTVPLAPGCKVPVVVIAVRRFALMRPWNVRFGLHGIVSTTYTLLCAILFFKLRFFFSSPRFRDGPLFHRSRLSSSPNTARG